MDWRRRWRDNDVRFCSKTCRMKRLSNTDRRLETLIRELLANRARGAGICPSEAARRVADGDAWRDLMEPARQAARRLAHAGHVEITQGGRIVDPSDFRGPIRIRVARGG